MDTDQIALHTSLIEQEEELLMQIDTWHLMLAVAWQSMKSSIEDIHLPTVRRLISSLRTIHQSIEDEMFDVRLRLLPFSKPIKSDPER